MNRRNLLKVLTATTALPFIPQIGESAPVKKVADNFIYCLNMATIRGHNLGLVKELEVASKAGFKGVEIWVDSLQTYLKNGGTLVDLKKRLGDLGLKVENTIGFANWITEDENKRKEGLEQMKREMDMLAQIGCKRTAAPPVGATDLPALDLRKVAERYRAVLELGDKTGVVPQLEMWGFSKNLSKVSEVMFVALETGHPSAKILLDIFHLYKGGSSLETLHMVSPSAIDVLHMNDHATSLSQANITDADRTYPGDGVAPIKQVLQTLGTPKKPLVISVEVFNKNYYKQPAQEVADTAFKKLKAVAEGIV